VLPFPVWQATAAFITALVLLLLSSCTSAEQAKQQFLEQGDLAFRERRFQDAVFLYRNAIARDQQFAEARLKLSDAYLAVGNLDGSYKELLRAADLLPGTTDVQLKAGRYLLVARQFQDAEARARAVLAREPRSVDAFILLGNALAGLNDLDGAIEQLQEAVALDPGRSETYDNLAVLLYGTGERKEAGQAFEHAVAAAPTSVPARLALANYYWAAGRRQKAEQALRQAIDIDPGNITANRALALMLLITNRAEAAEKPLQNAAAHDAAAKLALADFYIGTRRLADALTVLEPIQTSRTTSVGARIRIAEITYLQGHRPDAHLRLSALLEEHPDNLDVLTTRARWLLGERRLQEARKAASAAASLSDRAVAPRYLLGQIHASRNELDEAVRAFESVLALNGRVTAARIQLSRVLMAQGKIERAIQVAGDIMRRQPDNLPARLLNARGLLRQGDVAGAERIVRPLTARHPSSAPVLALAAAVALAKRDTPRARRLFEDALDRNPAMIEAFAGLVTIDLASGRPAQARARLEHALAGNGSSRDLLLLAGKSYLALKDYEKAAQTTARLIELDPSHLGAYELLARIYADQRRLDEALRHYQEVALRQPHSVPVRTVIAILLHAQNRLDDASTEYEAVLELAPNAPVPANNLAWIYAERGQNLVRALQLAELAQQQLPHDPRVNDTLGWVSLKHELPARAVRALERSVEGDPTNPVYHYHLGLAYVDVGESSKARQSLERALRIHPDFTHARDARRVLESLGS
jgi:tetratricopeptide (TPR) repeat protein